MVWSEPCPPPARPSDRLSPPPYPTSVSHGHGCFYRWLSREPDQSREGDLRAEHDALIWRSRVLLLGHCPDSTHRFVGVLEFQLCRVLIWQAAGNHCLEAGRQARVGDREPELAGRVDLHFDLGARARARERKKRQARFSWHDCFFSFRISLVPPTCEPKSDLMVVLTSAVITSLFCEALEANVTPPSPEVVTLTERVYE